MSHFQFQGGHIKWGTSNWGTYVTCSLIKWPLCCIDDYPWWLGYINLSYLWRRTFPSSCYDEIIPVHSGDYPKVFCTVKRSVFIPKNSGWWFQTWLSFSIIYGIILPIDFHFFKMVRTTDQNSGNRRWTSMIGATHTHRHALQIKWLQKWSHIPMAILEMTTHMIIWLNKNKTSNSIYMVLPCITMYYHHFLIGISLSLAQKCPSPSNKASMAPEADGKRRGFRAPDGMLRASAEWWELYGEWST